MLICICYVYCIIVGRSLVATKATYQGAGDDRRVAERAAQVGRQADADRDASDGGQDLPLLAKHPKM